MHIRKSKKKLWNYWLARKCGKRVKSYKYNSKINFCLVFIECDLQGGKKSVNEVCNGEDHSSGGGRGNDSL